MKTIDEVIESFERMSKSAREKARSIKPIESNIVFINDLFELAEEEEQIANWLKELKRLTMTENKGDLISREALKANMKKAEEQADTFEMLVEFYEQIIDNAPTVTPDKIQAIMSDYLVYRCEPQRPQGEWIPVSERLPKLLNLDEDIYNTHCSDYVLVCIEWWNGQKVIDKAFYDFDDEAWEYYGSDESEVIAWQPLPEPYKKGGNEE